MSGMVPELRFPGFEGEWQPKTIKRLLKRVSDPVNVEPEETTAKSVCARMAVACSTKILFQVQNSAINVSFMSCLTLWFLTSSLHGNRLWR